MTTAFRDRMLMTLEGDPSILNVAREVTRVLDEAGLDGAVIGGIAVVLHGHLRTTRDVDVYCLNTKLVAAALEKAGFSFDRPRKQFLKSTIPVHLVTLEQIESAPQTIEEIDGIRTVSLADLVSMKIRSGTKHIVRAQDLADVIGLIRARRLTSAFAPQVDKPLRGEFRKLVRAVGRDR